MLSRCSDIVDRRYVKTNLRAEKDLSDVAEVSMPGCTIYSSHGLTDSHELAMFLELLRVFLFSCILFYVSQLSAQCLCERPGEITSLPGNEDFSE